MKMKILPLVITLLFLSTAALAQTSTPTPPTPPNPVKAADPKDVGSIDAIMKAVYDVISGDATQKRDWDRFRSLFHPAARLIPTGKNPQTGVVGARALSPDEYVERASPVMAKDGFFEQEIARKVVQYGHIAHVFSTYQSLHKKDDKTPFARGINSFQLMNDGKRWWVITIYWEAETPENPIPAEFLK